jgi:hypothetical protein
MSENIHEAIHEVMKEVGYVQKDGKVSGGGATYSYAGETALIKAIRPKMVAQNIYANVPSAVVVGAEQYLNKSGTTMNLVRVLLGVRFTHAPSKTAIDSFAVGEGVDSGDKAANKAMTGAYKYALRQTFTIETGDDPDGSSSRDQERAPKGKTGLAARLTEGTVEGVTPREPEAKLEIKDWMAEARLNLVADNKDFKFSDIPELGITSKEETLPKLYEWGVRQPEGTNLAEALVSLGRKTAA